MAFHLLSFWISHIGRLSNMDHWKMPGRTSSPSCRGACFPLTNTTVLTPLFVTVHPNIFRFFGIGESRMPYVLEKYTQRAEFRCTRTGPSSLNRRDYLLSRDPALEIATTIC